MYLLMIHPRMAAVYCNFSLCNCTWCCERRRSSRCCYSFSNHSSSTGVRLLVLICKFIVPFKMFCIFLELINVL
uniref:Secreted protein n=1 Tax=Heterorhabditis bacteriophora TaxID=37862 RepID=A0A1I7WRL0_HETBA